MTIADKIRELTEAILRDRENKKGRSATEGRMIYTAVDVRAEMGLLEAWLHRVCAILSELLAISEDLEGDSPLMHHFRNKAFAFRANLTDIEKRHEALNYLREKRFDCTALPDIDAWPEVEIELRDMINAMVEALTDKSRND